MNKKIGTISVLLIIAMTFAMLIPTVHAKTMLTNDNYLYNPPSWQICDWNPEPTQVAWMSGGIAYTKYDDFQNPITIGNICFAQGYWIVGSTPSGQPFDPIPLNTPNLYASYRGKDGFFAGFYGISYSNLWGRAWQPVGNAQLTKFEIQLKFRESPVWTGNTYDTKTDWIGGKQETWYRAIISISDFPDAIYQTKVINLNSIILGMKNHFALTDADLAMMGITQITIGVEAWAGTSSAYWSHAYVYKN